MDGKRARVHSQKLNKFMKSSCIIYLSPEEGASMFLQVVGTHVHDAITQKGTVRFFLYLLVKQIQRRARNVCIHSAIQEMLTSISVYVIKKC